jgi:phosphoribosylformylglycinamidine synthase
MKFGVIIFPGSNCDRDVIHVLQSVMNSEVKMLWHKQQDLGGLTPDDCVVVPGGFSYGDYLRSGAIARFSPVMSAVKNHAAAGGKVVGICNGFQILCEAHLLPGALLRNKNLHFICDNVYLRVENNDTAFTSRCSSAQVLKIPIAHAEGRFYADEKTLTQIEENQQVLFRYCSAEGNTGDEFNPNGAMHHIAGICNAERNVFGMMPHPERCAESQLGNEDGKILFESLIASGIEGNLVAAAQAV